MKSGFRMTSQHCHSALDAESMYAIDAESRLCRDQHDKVEVLNQACPYEIGIQGNKRKL